MSLAPDQLSEKAVQFLAERHLATLSTVRADGGVHVVPVGFTWDSERSLARVITYDHSQKARNVERTGRAVLCQADGPRWITLEGIATVSADPDHVAEGVQRYARRYRPPRPNPQRVVLEIAVDRVLVSPVFLT